MSTLWVAILSASISLALICSILYYIFNRNLYTKRYAQIIVFILFWNAVGIIYRLVLLHFPPPDIHASLTDAVTDSITILQGYVSEFFIALLNIQTLDLFKILDDRITKFKLNILLTFYGILTVWSTIAHLLYNYTPSFEIPFAITLGAVTAILLLFDNFMGFYLSIIVLNRYKEMQISNKTLKSEKSHLIIANVVILVFGWCSAIWFTLVALTDMECK